MPHACGEAVTANTCSRMLEGRAHGHDSAIAADRRHGVSAPGCSAGAGVQQRESPVLPGRDSRLGCIHSSPQQISLLPTCWPCRSRWQTTPVEANKKRPRRAVFWSFFHTTVCQAALACCAASPAIEIRADSMAAAFCSSPTASPSARTNSTWAIPMKPSTERR